MSTRSKSSGKNNHPSHARYKSEQRWNKNKQRKLRKIFKQQPNNRQVESIIQSAKIS